MEYGQVQSRWLESSQAVMIKEMKKCFRVGLSRVELNRVRSIVVKVSPVQSSCNGKGDE